jgi:hypothetical protein
MAMFADEKVVVEVTKVKWNMKSNLNIHTNFINNLLTDIHNLNVKGQLLVSKLAV